MNNQNGRLDPGVDMTPAWAATLVKTIRGKPTAHDLLFKTTLAESRYSFFTWQVESLLNQSQELLERIQRESNQYDELLARALEISLQTYHEAQELENLKARLKKAAPIHNDDVPADSQPAINKLAATAADFDYEAMRNAAARTKEPIANTSWASFDSRLLNVQNEYQKNPRNEIGINQTVATRIQQYLEIYAKELLIPGTKNRAQLAYADAEQFERSLEYLDQIAQAKAAAFNPNGVYDFGPKLDRLCAQFTQDFIDVFARLRAAEKGLSQFFNYDGSLPYSGLPSDLNQSTLKDWIIWTRKASAWLVAFGHSEQVSTIVLPLSSLPGAKWTAQLADLQAGKNCVYEFDWDGGRIGQTQFFCRLRGISAIVIADIEFVLAGSVIPPINAKTKVSDSLWKDVTQAVAPCILGRVASHKMNREPEREGVLSHRNLSPISGNFASTKWKIELQKISGVGVIGDVHLELSVAYSTGSTK
jgi:hypothetical protein